LNIVVGLLEKFLIEFVNFFLCRVSAEKDFFFFFDLCGKKFSAQNDRGLKKKGCPK